MVVRISYSPGRSLGKWSGFLKILSKAGGKNQYEPSSVLVEWSGKSFWKEKNIKKGGGAVYLVPSTSVAPAFPC